MALSALTSPSLMEPLPGKGSIPGKDGVQQSAPLAAQQTFKPQSSFDRMVDKSPEEQYNIFIKLLVTQVQNQSIDDPMSTHEMTQSTLSFYQTAEMVQTNKLLKHGNDLKLQEQVSMAKSYLNKDVEYEGDVLTFNGKAEKVRFDMPPNIKQAHLIVCDATGRPFKNYPLTLTPGETVVEWDGSSDAHPDKQVPNGQYIVKIHAVDKEDGVVSIPTILKGKVREINYENDHNEFVLRVNDTAVGLSDILTVSKSSNQELIDLNNKLQEQLAQTKRLTQLLESSKQIPETDTVQQIVASEETAIPQNHPIWG